MSGSANVFLGGYRKDQQMSGSANVRVESANGRLAEISKCLSQQMSKPSQLVKSGQQKLVSKSPVGKCQIGVYLHTISKYFVLFSIDGQRFLQSVFGFHLQCFVFFYSVE